MNKKSTDYKNLFNKPKDYSNLFDSQDSKMKYKNLFQETEPTKQPHPASPEPETKRNYSDMFKSTAPAQAPKPTRPVQAQPSVPNTPKFSAPKFNEDPRLAELDAYCNDTPGNSVLRWVDNFEVLLKELGEANQQLSEAELKMAQEFTDERSGIQDLFTGIKLTLSKLKAPAPKRGILKLLSNTPEFKLTRDMIDDCIKELKRLMNEYGVKQKYSTVMFVKSKLDSIQHKIVDLKLNTKCADVACRYLIDKGDFKAQARLERITKIGQIVTISELALKNAYDMLNLDLESYEELKQTTVPLLYIKLQNLLNSTLDSEVLNIINKIDEL